MYEIGYTGQFKKDLKLIKKRSEKDFELLRNFIKELQKTGIKGIDQKHNPHKLKGKYSQHYECHVINDLLLIWLQNETKKIIILERTGTHSDLF
jgi:mRNA interferase YafQ